MGEERFALSRDRPPAAPAAASLGLLPDRPPRPAPQPEAAPARPSPPILERFRAMLKEREEDLRGPDGEDDVPPPMADEIVLMYEEVLAELAFNSKPIITELTIIAGDQREFGEGIADAICSRIVEVPVEQKLPCLYLLDSIVKNIGREYVRHFAVRLPEVFCEAYNQVPPNLYPAMRHLFRTWSQVFPSLVLRKIENELQFSSPESQQSSGSGNARLPESPSPRPAHGIHVNPKYLKPGERDPRIRTRPAEFAGDMAERNLAESPKGWSGASPSYHDIQHPRETSSLGALEQKSSSKYDYDLDQSDGILQSGSTKRGSLQQVGTGRLPTLVGNGKPHPFPKSDLLRPSSPKVGPGRVTKRSVWQEQVTPAATLRQPEVHSSYNLVSEFNKNRPRELIDAYGNSKGKNVLSEKPFKVQRLESNGLSTDLATKKWQNSEEEEYVWEDMSPTLADRSRNNSLMPYDTNVESFGLRTRMNKPDASILDADFRRSSWSIYAQPPTDLPPSILSDDRVPILGPGHRSINKGPRSSVERNELPQFQSSHYSQEPWKSHYIPTQSLSPKSLGKIVQTSFSAGRGGSAIGQRLPPYHYTPESDLSFQRLSSIHSESTNTDTLPSVSSAITAEKLLVQRPSSPSVVPPICPPAHKSQPLPPFPVPLQQKHYAGQLSSVDSSSAMMNQGPNTSFTSPWQPSDAFDRKSSMFTPTSHQDSGSIAMNPQNKSHAPRLRFQYQESHGSVASSGKPQIPPHAFAQSINQTQALGAGSFSGSLSGPPPPSSLLQRVPENSFNMHGGPPPLPPGPPPVMSQIGAASSNPGSLVSNPPGSGFSGLISSLMSQGLISLAPQTSVQDSIGTEFNPDLLKVRHESALSDLYVNLPRQCTTCGLRFKCQVEHSSHMDWHVTKNRMSKNRKQKPSRKWFVSAKEWLSGAEALGADAVPGFLPSDTVVEKTEEKELAVPADEDQNLCALCAEPFEDFYSDEADEWMYRGAVYLNAPTGSTEGLERSQLGPIVHAKCRSESTGNQGQA